jgi:hypothetical protein
MPYDSRTNKEPTMIGSNMFNKIKNGFYWYNNSFQSWKELMVIDKNDTEKIKILSDHIFSNMNIMTGSMKVSSKDWKEKYIVETELRNKVFQEQVVQKIESYYLK